MLDLLLHEVAQQRLLNDVFAAPSAFMLRLLLNLSFSNRLEKVLIVVLHTAEDTLKLPHEGKVLHVCG